MKENNIILTGFMGTGKSTVGRLLAERLGYDFIDTDSVIEAETSRSIADIFETEGEATFRKLEAELVQRLAQKSGLVIATGGGLVTNPENVTALQASGKIICLTAPAEEILKRVTNQDTVRPLLQEENPLEKIKQLLRQREPVYRQFVQINTSDVSLEELTDKILESGV